MGTRGVIGIIFNGKTKASYNHFDSYPECLGLNVLDFLYSYVTEQTIDIEKLKRELLSVEWIDINEKPTEAIKDKCAKLGIINTGVSRGTNDDWYCLFRGGQGDFQKYIELGMAPDNTSFLNDGLFCEWAYLIDLDNNKLIVCASGYKIVCEFSLFDLPPTDRFEGLVMGKYNVRFPKNLERRWELPNDRTV